MTNLYDKIELQRTWIVVLVILLIGSFMLIVSLFVKVDRLRDSQIAVLKATHETNIDIELLCRVNNALETELRVQTEWKGFWGEDVRAICK